MKRLRVTLARLVRDTKNVVVDVPDDFDENDEYAKGDLASFLFANDLEYATQHDWEADNEWEEEEGTHHVAPLIRGNCDPDVTLHLDEDGGFVIWNSGDEDTDGG